MARPKNSNAPDTRRAVELTVGAIERLMCPPDKAQDFLRDSKAPGLRVRVTKAGAKSFVFEAKLDRQTIRRTIGDVRAWTIPQARKVANELRTTLDKGTDPREVERQQRADREAVKLKAEQVRQFTLANLLADYVEHQKGLGRVSYKDATGVFKHHVLDAWPRVAALPACEVTDEQVADMMRKVIEAGKGRTANKLRTYMAAAYQLAKHARTDPTVPLKFKGYGIRMNPAADTSPDRASNRPDKNPLRLPDLQRYWQHIKGAEGLSGAVLRLHLLTGGQRIEQFLRLLTANITEDAITLYDGKGRPGAGIREIVLPLLPEAREAIRACRPTGAFALSSDGGRTHLWNSTFASWASRAASAAGIEGFEPKRIRSGVETQLAAMGFSKDYRGRLQSHGISGVQDRHYDGHEYLDVKRRQLEALFAALEGTTDDNVVPLPRAA